MFFNHLHKILLIFESQSSNDHVVTLLSPTFKLLSPLPSKNIFSHKEYARTKSANKKAQANRLRYRSRVNGATRASLTLYTAGSFGNHDVMCRRRRRDLRCVVVVAARPTKTTREILSRSRFYELFFSASSFGQR